MPEKKIVVKAEKTPPVPTKTQLSGKLVVLILGSLVIVAAAVIVVVFLLRTPEEPVPEQTVESPTVGGAQIINMENVEDITSQIQENVDRGMFETHMNMTWTFADGKSPSHDAVMGNSPNNNYAFYFTLTLSNGDVVFTSGLMPVGTQISEIILEQELSAGIYPAVVNVNMMEDDGTPIESNMGFNVTIIIES